jgi:hypothetical protein
LAEAEVPFEVPRGNELSARRSPVFEVFYVIFSEGYSATAGVESRQRLEVVMRLFALLGLLAVFLDFPATTFSQGSSQGDTSQQPDIGRSGTDFMKICSNAVGAVDSNPQHIQNDATCLGWVEGFVDGLTVHEELLGVPKADRLVCISRNVTNIQVVQAIKKYVGANPDKAHRSTRLVASVALAQAFPCKRAK